MVYGKSVFLRVVPWWVTSLPSCMNSEAPCLYPGADAILPAGRATTLLQWAVNAVLPWSCISSLPSSPRTLQSLFPHKASLHQGLSFVPSLCAMAFNLSLCSDSRQTCSSPVPCPLHLASWRLSVIKFCVPGHPGNQYCSNFICVCSSNFKKNLQSTKENYFYISLYHEHTRGWTNVLQKHHLTHNDGVQCGAFKSFPFYSGWVNFISGH